MNRLENIINPRGKEENDNGCEKHDASIERSDLKPCKSLPGSPSRRSVCAAVSQSFVRSLGLPDCWSGRSVHSMLSRSPRLPDRSGSVCRSAARPAGGPRRWTERWPISTDGKRKKYKEKTANRLNLTKGECGAEDDVRNIEARLIGEHRANLVSLRLASFPGPRFYVWTTSFSQPLLNTTISSMYTKSCWY